LSKDLPTPVEPASSTSDGAGVGRREFLKVAGASAGILALGACTPDAEVVPGLLPHPRITILNRRTDVVVVGGGLWGSFTAYNLRKRGARVTLVDQYGVGNSRSTSGDETRGVRSTYGNKENGELWMLWAREAMKRWQEFDSEWSRYWQIEVFAKTGDLCCRRDETDNITKRTKEWWDKHKVPYEVIPVDEVKKRWPVIDLTDIGYALYEPDAGVLRARRAAQHASTALEKMGGKVVIGRVQKLMPVGSRLEQIELDTGEKLRADYFVFALGPWMRTFFPDVLGQRMRTPLAQVCYFATPPGDERFTFPNLPSYNFPGVTGWPALPVDSRGFRVRGGRAAPNATGAGSGGGAAGGAAGGRAGAGAGANEGGRGGRGGRAGRGDGGRGGRGGRAGAGGSLAGRAGAGQGGRGAAGSGGGRGGGGAGGGFGGGNADPATQDPDLSNRAANLDGIESSRRFLAERFPLLANAPISETRACHYESSVGGEFIIDWHPDISNVLLAGAGNAEGAKFAPVVGDYASQRVLGIAGDPEVVARFAIPKHTYESLAAEQAARADSLARADSVSRADSAMKADSAARAARGGRGGE
jgi:sarcosine oxidase